MPPFSLGLGFEQNLIFCTLSSMIISTLTKGMFFFQKSIHLKIIYKQKNVHNLMCKKFNFFNKNSILHVFSNEF
jgi:hypothetical protein